MRTNFTELSQVYNINLLVASFFCTYCIQNIDNIADYTNEPTHPNRLNPLYYRFVIITIMYRSMHAFFCDLE